MPVKDIKVDLRHMQQIATSKQSEKCSIEDEEQACAHMDRMLVSMHHRQRSLKLQCFSALTLHVQRIKLMEQMGAQMDLHSRVKLAHKCLYFWHKRFLDRQQRKNRENIATGYHKFRTLSHAFAALVEHVRAEQNIRTELIQSHRMAFKACAILAATALEQTPEASNSEIGTRGKSRQERHLQVIVFG